MVIDDPMLDCLVDIDKSSWKALEDLFQAFAEEDKAEKFLAVSEQIKQDPVVKGKYSNT